MQATELYDLGCRAYNGDRDARRGWLAALAPIAAAAAVPYGVLPGLAMAKAALESGFATDLYEVEFYEPQYKVKMARKAQRHNNVIGMNAFADNFKYLDWLKASRWSASPSTFRDYGPHFDGDKIVMAPDEPWKHFECVEDCLEDWCANIRYQAEAHNKPWGMTIEQQLLAIESYTPEGTKAETPGMHFEWQDYILYMYKDYDLYAYDRRAYGMSVKMTQENLDSHIRSAYAYAHAHCKYGPTDRHFPPFEDGVADCVGLALRALYTMGYNDARHNINEIHALCVAAGLTRSDNADDAWKHHGIVCMCPKGDKANVAHVYYSLGGKGADSIDKYDLGSDERICTVQPFKGCHVNEWKGKREFLCVYYARSDRREDVPHFEVKNESVGTVVKRTGLYAGPGTAWRHVKTVEEGTRVISRGVVTSDAGKQWRSVRLGGKEGYIYAGAVSMDMAVSWRGKVSGTDGSLSLRVGAGAGCYKVADIPEGTAIRVDGEAVADDGGEWLHVKYGKMRGFVAAMFVKEEK